VPDAPVTVLFAPDSFKGSLTSVEVAEALAEGWARARPDDELLLSPLADGGEGTLAAAAAAGGWAWLGATAHDPIGRPITAKWLRSVDGRRAIVELAAASGLSRLGRDELDPLGASTFGTGEVIRAALDAGVESIAVGIGGSATNDGGRGMLEAIGTGDAVDALLAGVDVVVACDVSNPLLGASGAAATYGPQKGASPEQVELLDRRLAIWADELERQTGRHERDTPGAGAAGGVGFAFLCIQDRFQSFALRPGVELLMEATGFDDKLARADVVVTGEGRIDAQTAFGKTALGVARRAADAGVPCVAVGGGVAPEGIAALEPLGVAVVPVVEGPQSIEAAMAAGRTPVVRCGERIARLASILAER
jgi:glycerate 2-kinase